MVSKEDIPEGLLVIPVFCMRESSFLYDPKDTRAHDDVVGRVMWEEEAEQGGKTQVEKESPVLLCLVFGCLRGRLTFLL